MTIRGQAKRLERVRHQFGALPVDPAAVRQAFGAFVRTGELPQGMRLAYAVVRRAQTGIEPITSWREVDWSAIARQVTEKRERPKDQVMDELYYEAVLGDGIVRAAARHVLRGLASAGLDVSQPLFASKDLNLPDYGGVGLHMLGFEQRLAKAPYKRQAKQLFARCATLRERIGGRDRRWFDRLGEAVEAFQHFGDLPDDALMLDCILAVAEISTLCGHFCGADVAELMRAFGEAASAKGAAREVAIRRLRELVASQQRNQHESAELS